MTEPNKPDHTEHVPRMSDDELRAFVEGYCNRQIFTSANITDDSLLGSVFMPLVFGAFEKASQAYLEEIGVLWERMSEAGLRSINGMPVFFSMHIMHADDWKRVRAAIKLEEQRRKAIELDPR